MAFVQREFYEHLGTAFFHGVCRYDSATDRYELCLPDEDCWRGCFEQVLVAIHGFTASFTDELCALIITTAGVYHDAEGEPRSLVDAQAYFATRLTWKILDAIHVGTGEWEDHLNLLLALIPRGPLGTLLGLDTLLTLIGIHLFNTTHLSEEDIRRAMAQGWQDRCAAEASVRGGSPSDSGQRYCSAG